MKSIRRAMMAVTVLALVAIAPAQEPPLPTKPKEAAKVYEATLQGMIGQPFGKVLSTIDGWKFQALAAWEAVSPTEKEVASHDRNKIKFSKKEIAEIFGPGGAFKVVVYNKLVGTEQTTMGSVDSMGMGAGKDTAITVEKYAVIRAVFKDNALHVFKVWPTMDQAGMSGGMMFHR
jgi:hypothetical protein